MAKSTPRLGPGLKSNDRILSDADFAEDLALIAESVVQLVEALHNLQEEAAKVGLQVNWDKTTIMVVDPSSSITNLLWPWTETPVDVVQ